MITGIGIDLVEVGRIAETRRRWGDRFLQRVFTRGELSDCLGTAGSDRRLAARFAAKEAALKALGSGLALGARWLDIEVKSGEHRAPHLRFSGAAHKLMLATGAKRAFLSLSHTDGTAAAVVVLES